MKLRQAGCRECENSTSGDCGQHYAGVCASCGQPPSVYNFNGGAVCCEEEISRLRAELDSLRAVVANVRWLAERCEASEDGPYPHEIFGLLEGQPKVLAVDHGRWSGKAYWIDGSAIPMGIGEAWPDVTRIIVERGVK